MDQETINSLIIAALLFISEILPFINIKANGILEVIIQGLIQSFTKQRLPASPDIEAAQSLVSSQEDILNIVNHVKLNTQLKNIILDLIDNPENIKNIQELQKNNDLSHLLSSIIYNKLDPVSIVKAVQTSTTTESK